MCDVPNLEDKLVVFTDRQSQSPFYQSFVAGGIRLDIRRLRPSDVIAIALSPERQEQQNVRKLRGLSQERWESLVNLIDDDGNATSLDEIYGLLDLEKNQEAEALAARANMTTIVRMLHDKSSQLMDMLVHALSEGKLCVIDVSRMRGGQSLILSGLILRRIFDRNQEEFTSADPKTIPTIAVVEEAQSVLNENAPAAGPYIEWVKEGRKYDLGALLITQQPGSIPVEILSQGDNWFIFHLLSAADLTTLKRANAHFSDDLLSSLLNEPIPGQGVFWSSVGDKPYPVSLRALLFEKMFPIRDLGYNRPAGCTYAQTLRNTFSCSRQTSSAPHSQNTDSATVFSPDDMAESDSVDVMANFEQQAIDALRSDSELKGKIESPEGVAWGAIKAFLLEHLPPHLDDRDQLAYRLVKKSMDALYGSQDQNWETYRHPQRNTTYVRTKG